MRNVKYIIEDIRTSTENEDVTEFIGITDKEILRFINDAHHRLQAEIVKKSAKVFITEKIFTATGQEEYVLPPDIFLGNKITDVKYRLTKGANNWRPVDRAYVRNRDLDYAATPRHYIRQAGSIFLRPQPHVGELRVTYVQRLPQLDLQRAVVDSVVLDESNRTITSLILNTTTEEIDSRTILRDNFITVVDELGEIKMSNIRITGIDTVTGAVTIHPSHNFDLEESITSGDIIVSGKYSSIASPIDDSIERYIIAYAGFKILQRDGSQEASTQVQVMQNMLQEIVDSYAVLDDDIDYIPDIDEDFDEL